MCLVLLGNSILGVLTMWNRENFKGNLEEVDKIELDIDMKENVILWLCISI